MGKGRTVQSCPKLVPRNAERWHRFHRCIVGLAGEKSPLRLVLPLARAFAVLILNSQSSSEQKSWREVLEWGEVIPLG